MKAMKKPCQECPFLTTSCGGWLGNWSTPLELHNYVMGENPFPCHLTHQEEDLPSELVGTEKHPLCAGALAYMKRNGKWPRDRKIADAIKSIEFDREQILSSPDFITHHTIKK